MKDNLTSLDHKQILSNSDAEKKGKAMTLRAYLKMGIPKKKAFKMMGIKE